MWANRLDPLERLLVIALSAFPFLPFGVSNASLIVLVILRLFQTKGATLPSGKDWLLLTPAALIILSWAFHGLAPDGLREIRLWPILLAAVVYFKTSTYRALFNRSFVITSAIGGVIVLGSLVLGEPLPQEHLSQFIRDAITERFAWHPTYLSTLWAWASLLLWSDSLFHKHVRLTLSAFLVGMAAMAGGKMPLLAMMITGVLGLWFFSSWPVKWKAAAAGLCAALLIAISFSPALRDRVGEFQNLSTDYEEDAWLTSTELRLGVWQCAWQCTMDNKWLGAGVGRTRPVLEACFKDYDQSEFFDTEFNTHNQYLHFWFSGGILAFMIFLAYGVWLLWQNRTQRTAFLFLLFFLLISLTENYFSRQIGMMLFALFLQIPVLNSHKKENVSH
ncbi:MAG: O-antigen ligase family protein [Flavobacteriales bacterium]